MTEEPTEEVRRVLDALDQVEAMEDPVARARAVNELLKDQPNRNKRLKALRDDTVRRLRADGMSYRKIAAEVHTSLGTVQDILRGHTGTWSSRPRKGEGEADDEGGGE
ncbi:hypothetical protein AB0D45_02685 [Streptomyces sp. NPDC048352]|uniref:hypothetical protein n=1 Tax=Streptomyces sp. NPDC048352 TaxID=3154718 RepID=UPI003447B301